MRRKKKEISTKPSTDYPMGKMLLELGWGPPEHSMDTWKQPIKKKGIKREGRDVSREDIVYRTPK